MAKNTTSNYGMELLAWNIPEYEKHDRGMVWYVVTSIVLTIFIIYGIYTNNYMFVIIIALFILISIINYYRGPEMIDFVVTTEGLIIGDKFHDYDNIKNFAIIYKPNDNIKSLYLEFDSFLKQRMTIPLMDMNPLVVRKELIKYTMENLERKNEPNTDYITKRLKL